MFDDIKDKIGKPYFETEDIAIFQGDSMKLLKALPDSCIDTVITSPPYNIGKNFGNRISFVNSYFSEVSA